MGLKKVKWGNDTTLTHQILKALYEIRKKQG